MAFTHSTLAALVIAASFAAGLNVYATVLTLGLLARAHAVVLPPGLDALAAWWVIGASGALFSAEFIADKIPGLDLVWNALHTFVRVPVAALLAYRATTQRLHAIVGRAGGSSHCSCRPRVEDGGAGCHYPQPGAGIEYCLQHQRRCGGHRNHMAGDMASLDCRRHRAGAHPGGAADAAMDCPHFASAVA
jgi:hypothetical protein